MAATSDNSRPANQLIPAGAESEVAASHGPLHPIAVWKRLRRDRLALFGGFVVCCFVVIAILAPLIAPYSPEARDTKQMNKAPFWLKNAGSSTIDSSGEKHFFGRDVQGRDVLSRVIYGTQTSLCIGVAVVTIASLIGVTLGSIAGYVGGFIESLIMRMVDIILAFPFLILALAIVSIIPQVKSYHVAVVLGCASWPGIARLMRGQVLATRELDYVNAAKALGAGHSAILFRHIMPNCIAPVIISFMMGIAGAIMAEASLSFLGMGDPNSLGWGALIDTGMNKANFPTEWWAVTFPALALAMLALGFNLLGDGLQDAINPRLKN